MLTKIAGILILLLVAISPLFKGLFFPLEMNIFFALISILSIVYFVNKAIRKEEINLPGWITILGLILIAAYAVSFISAVNPRENIGSLIQYTTYFFVAIIVYDLLRDLNKNVVQSFLIAIVGVGFIASVIGLEGYTKVFSFLNDTIFGDRLGSVFQYTNTAAIYFLMIYILMLSLMLNTQSVLLRMLLAGAANTVLLALFYTGSRGGYVFTLAAVIMFFLITPKAKKIQCIVYIALTSIPLALSIKGFGANSAISNYITATKWMALSFFVSVAVMLTVALVQKVKPGRNRKIIMISSTTIILAAAILVFFKKLMSGPISVIFSNMVPGKIIDRLTSINFHETNFIARVAMDKDALELIRTHWLTGYGGGGWTALYQSVQDYFYTARAVHNHYMQVFVESGIAGFLSFTLLTISAFLLFAYILLKSIDIKQRVYAAGCLTAFFALSAHSIMDFNLTYGAMALIWWSFLAIAAYWYADHKGSSRIYLQNKLIKSRTLISALIIVCAILVFFSSKYAIGAYYGGLAEKCTEGADFAGAISYYETAVNYDGMNAAYYSNLADLCNKMASRSETDDQMTLWRKKAIDAGETSIRLNPDYPYYNYILTQVYFDSGMVIKAYEQAEKLVALQPMALDNYELLARGLVDAGLQYYEDKDISKARVNILKCADTDNDKNAPHNPVITFYRGKSLLLLGKYTEAEQLLNYARGGSLTLKIDSDRLLYIINQETGRETENEKYRMDLWMGMVEKTREYKLIKQILNSKILQNTIEN